MHPAARGPGAERGPQARRPVPALLPELSAGWSGRWNTGSSARERESRCWTEAGQGGEGVGAAVDRGHFQGQGPGSVLNGGGSLQVGESLITEVEDPPRSEENPLRGRSGRAPSGAGGPRGASGRRGRSWPRAGTQAVKPCPVAMRGLDAWGLFQTALVWFQGTRAPFGPTFLACGSGTLSRLYTPPSPSKPRVPREPGPRPSGHAAVTGGRSRATPLRHAGRACPRTHGQIAWA